ncbi:MAG: hypothetical protein AB7O28_14600 [Vicinamibacterales bacterium]
MTETTPHLSHDDLVVHYYGDAGADAGQFDAHLAGCADCRAALERLAKTLSFVDAAPGEEPDAGLEARLWSRLAPALDDRPARPRSKAGAVTKWALLAAAAGIVLAFVGGWLVRDRSASAPAVSATGPAPSADPGGTPAAVQTRVLVLAVGDHLERTEAVLAELMNTTDVGMERDRAAELVAANRLLRQTAEQTGEDELDEVLGDIERVLVEVANAPPDASDAALEALRARVERRGILFRVRVLGDELRTRQAPARTPAVKGKTS